MPLTATCIRRWVLVGAACLQPTVTAVQHLQILISSYTRWVNFNLIFVQTESMGDNSSMKEEYKHTELPPLS